MSEQARNATVTLEHDDGVKAEDLFRRAAFGWALSTKRLVESSRALGVNTRVAYAALADIEYAKELLDSLFMPAASKTPAAYADRENLLTAEIVKSSVSGLVTRIATSPPSEVRKTPFNARVDRSPHRGADLSTPVYPRNGKMLWAGVDCPVCPSKAKERCRKDDGGYVEKPHPQRKNLAEAA